MKVGDIVEVTWRDACGYSNVDRSAVKVAMAVNIGVLVRDDESEIVLQSGTYEDGSGDFTIIPKAWSDKMTLVRKAKK